VPIAPPVRSIRFCQVVASLSRCAGGLFESVRGLALALDEIPSGPSFVVGLSDRFTLEDRPAWGNVRTMAVDIVGPAAFGYAPGLARAVREARPDVIVNHGIWMYPSILVHRIAAELDVPYIVSPHGMLDPWALAHSRWKKSFALAAYESQHLRGAACLRALNESEAASMRKLGLKAPICIIPNGVHLPRNTDVAPAPNWKVAIPAGKKVMLFLGRLHPKKGLSELITAWSTSLRTLADWQLIIAGWDEGGHEAALRAQAEGSPAKGSITFVGPIFGEQKHRTLSHSDAFILPSKSEGLPMAVLEAWAYRVPVLMSHECNLPFAFSAGAAIETGTSPPLIAAALQEFAATSVADADRLARRGYDLVSASYTWDNIALEFSQVAAWLKGVAPQPASVFEP